MHSTPFKLMDHMFLAHTTIHHKNYLHLNFSTSHYEIIYAVISRASQISTGKYDI
jgi:hypothetical protein